MRNTRGKTVLVNVAKLHVKSPHTVDLSGKMEKPKWHGVDVFQEAPRDRESRQVIDWAEMVREANKSQKSVEFESPKVHKVRKSIKSEIEKNIQYLISNIKNGTRSSLIALHQSFSNALNAILNLKLFVPVPGKRISALQYVGISSISLDISSPLSTPPKIKTILLF